MAAQIPVILVPPEVGGLAAHSFAAAQHHHAVAVGAEGLLRGVGGGGDGVVGLGVAGGFHRDGLLVHEYIIS